MDSWPERLAQRLVLTEDERAYLREIEGRDDLLPVRITDYYLSLIDDSPDDPLRRQAVPRIQELTWLDYELSDPLGENRHRAADRLIHRYRDRVLVLATDSCAMYCRHCFRRGFAGHRNGAISEEQLAEACEYIRVHDEVTEVILSGGDPLTLPPPRLGLILSALRDARPEAVFRVGTRLPVVLPANVTDRLVAVLSEAAPLWVVAQFNHPREITASSTEAVLKLVRSGVPVVNQTVLLEGVNDTVGTLEELFHGLVRMRVKPYYLFQGDLARGTAHLRVPLRRGLELVRCLRSRLSGLAMPTYAVDLPGGGGKVPLTESYLEGEENGRYRFIAPDGREFFYPVEAMDEP
jgi:lysine 2,3-aminomutase